ncbi:hypothetical protein [Kitasatospora sp. NPDC051164]|uniref:hypothetical protein n=1 Tax=Kitasatospora sp. NPDC051164 TaxID=3364055 RepID=UPI0037BC0A27
MPDLWMPGAEVHDLGDHAPTDQQYPPKAIAHITWDRNATAAAPADWVPFDSLVSYFTGSGAPEAPHIIWDPFTGRIAQLFPADSRSKSVVDSPGGTRTNRAGRVVIQIEAVFFPYCRYQGRVYPRLVDTPCAGWDRLHAWIASWGVPDVWPMGHPVDFTPHRDETTWETRGGWYAHAHVPENDHEDPGSWPDFTTEEDPLAAFTEDDLRRIIADTVKSIDVRDALAYAAWYKLQPEIAAVADQVWEHGLPQVDAEWNESPSTVPAKWLAAGIRPLLFGQAAAAAVGGADPAVVKAAIDAAAAKFAEVLAQSTVHVQVDVNDTTPKGSA